MSNHRRFLSIVLLSTALVSSADAAVQYTFTNLGTLGGNSSSAAAINNSGAVVGISTINADGLSRAFLYQNGTMTDLGSLGGAEGDSGASAINDAGVVVGNSSTSTASALFSYSNGTMTNLGTFGGSYAFATDINSAGIITAHGPNARPPGGYLGHFGNASGFTSVGSLGSSNYSVANAINNAGTVVGVSAVGDIEQPVVYSGGTLSVIRPSNEFSGAIDINNSGTIIGTYVDNTTFQKHGFLYSNGVATNLTELGVGSEPKSINDANVIVGNYNTENFERFAFIYQNGVMTDLNTLVNLPAGTVLNAAYAINNNGQIVGEATVNGETRAFLLTAVPEPTALAALPAAAVLFRRRR